MEHHNWIVPIDLISELISTGRSWLLDDKLLEAPGSKSFLFPDSFDNHDLVDAASRES
jgi:hypothetical protein